MFLHNFDWVDGKSCRRIPELDSGISLEITTSLTKKFPSILSNTDSGGDNGRVDINDFFSRWRIMKNTKLQFRFFKFFSTIFVSLSLFRFCFMCVSVLVCFFSYEKKHVADCWITKAVEGGMFFVREARREKKTNDFGNDTTLR